MSPSFSLPEINGPRPSPLNIRRDSHQIQKASPSTNHRQRPVIIYTHSPKIIHTEARDFMALVQKLTGMASNPSPDRINRTPTTPPAAGSGTTEAAELGLGFDAEHVPTSTSFDMHQLFSRGSSDFFCSPGMGGLISPSTLSFMDAIKALPEF